MECGMIGFQSVRVVQTRPLPSNVTMPRRDSLVSDSAASAQPGPGWTIRPKSRILRVATNPNRLAVRGYQVVLQWGGGSVSAFCLDPRRRVLITFLERNFNATWYDRAWTDGRQHG